MGDRVAPESPVSRPGFPFTTERTSERCEMSEKKEPTYKPEFDFYGTEQFKAEIKKFRNKNGDEFKLVTEKGPLPSHLQERKPPCRINIPPEVYQFIYDFMPEFERIWEAVKTLPGTLSL